jgi:hypothetical protein
MVGMQRVLAFTIASLVGCAHPAGTREPAAPVSAAGWVAFEVDGVYGYKDAMGKVVVPPRFKMAVDADGALACAVGEQGWICVDGRGEEVLRPHVVDNGPEPFVDGRARFVDVTGYGFYDRRGVKVIPAQFDYVTEFAEQRAAYCVGCKKRCAPEGSPCSMEGGKWGVIDPQGRALTGPTYVRISAYEGGVARAIEGGVEVRLDRDGRVVP